MRIESRLELFARTHDNATRGRAHLPFNSGAAEQLWFGKKKHQVPGPKLGAFDSDRLCSVLEGQRSAAGGRADVPEGLHQLGDLETHVEDVNFADATTTPAREGREATESARLVERGTGGGEGGSD